MMPVHHHRRGRHRGVVTDVYHHIVCRHQVEIEVWPPRAEIHFRDDWTANVATTQVRFEAQVYNSTQGYVWDVRDINGGRARARSTPRASIALRPRARLPAGPRSWLSRAPERILCARPSRG